jgi:hypothetical protein
MVEKIDKLLEPVLKERHIAPEVIALIMAFRFEATSPHSDAKMVVDCNPGGFILEMESRPDGVQAVFNISCWLDIEAEWFSHKGWYDLREATYISFYDGNYFMHTGPDDYELERAGYGNVRKSGQEE